MPEIRHLTAADVRRMPWKNGRGVTEELLLWPPGASFERGDFEWRLARAGVTDAGPFSVFPGFERILVVTEGEGLLLRHGAAPPVRVGRLQPHRFSGDEETTAELLGGPICDVNVLARRGRVMVSAAMLNVGRRALVAGAGHLLLHVLRGRATAAVDGKTVVTLVSRESLWIREGTASTAIELAGDECVALLLRVDAAGL